MFVEISGNINISLGSMVQEFVMPLIYPSSVPKLGNDQ